MHYMMPSAYTCFRFNHVNHVNGRLNGRWALEEKLLHGKSNLGDGARMRSWSMRWKNEQGDAHSHTHTQRKVRRGTGGIIIWRRLTKKTGMRKQLTIQRIQLKAIQCYSFVSWREREKIFSSQQCFVFIVVCVTFGDEKSLSQALTHKVLSTTQNNLSKHSRVDTLT